MSNRGVYKVNYSKNGQDASAFVCAESGADAVAFLGASSVPGTSIALVAFPVEVSGLDTAHDSIAPPVINVAPPMPAKQLSDSELAQLRALLLKPSASKPDVPPSPPEFVAK